MSLKFVLFFDLDQSLMKLLTRLLPLPFRSELDSIARIPTIPRKPMAVPPGWDSRGPVKRPLVTSQTIAQTSHAQEERPRSPVVATTSTPTSRPRTVPPSADTTRPHENRLARLCVFRDAAWPPSLVVSVMPVLFRIIHLLHLTPFRRSCF